MTSAFTHDRVYSWAARKKNINARSLIR